MRTNRFVFLLTIALLTLAPSGCNLPAASPTSTPTLPPSPTLLPHTQTPTLTPTLSPTAVPGPTFTPSPTPTEIDLQPVTVPAPQTPAGYSTEPSVLIADGRCCVGGIVGSQTEVTVSFKPAFAATDMRYRAAGACLTEAELAQTSWQPFAPAVTLPVPIATINWIGLYVSAQYRDAVGSLSPVVCDDISVEGMPARTP